MKRLERFFDELPLAVKFAGGCIVVTAMWAVCISWLMLGSGQSAAERVAADQLIGQSQYLAKVVTQ